MDVPRRSTHVPGTAGGATGKPAGLASVGVVILAIVLALVVGVRGQGLPFEDQFFYHPKSQLVGTPADRGLPFEDVWFGPDDSLHGWFVAGERDVVILWLHGNGGNISHRLDLLERLYQRLGASFFLFDYPGYGQSGGAPSEQRLYASARAALAYLRSRPDTANQQIVYFGKSLGAAVAVQLALEQPPDRLLLQSGFTSIQDVASWYVPVLPLGALLHTRFPSIERISRVQAPLLIVHGDHDTIVPVDHSRALYHAAAEPKCLLIVAGAGHDDIPLVAGADYADRLRTFIESRQSLSDDCFGEARHPTAAGQRSTHVMYTKNTGAASGYHLAPSPEFEHLDAGVQALSSRGAGSAAGRSGRAYARWIEWRERAW